jgi:hypothetical protein
MSGWRVAGSLLTLRSQIDALYPGRDKASDGTVGDAAHQAEQSDHNPDSQGIVRALDITHDPAHGCDIDKLTDALAAGRDPRISYVIANQLIMSGPAGPDPWVWRTYGGSDPHTNHVHISVVADVSADRTTTWALPGLTGEGLMATAEEKINAMMMGFPSTADGDPVCPTRWQIATEAFQAEVRKDLAEIKAQPTITIDYPALAKALIDALK